MLDRFLIPACNVAWWLACLPGWIRFLSALRHPRRAQERILRRLLRRNQGTPFGLAHEFSTIRTPADFARRVPLAEYADFEPAIAALRNGAGFPLAADKVFLLEPTSGSSSAPKWIPCTTALRREFQAAVDPWIAWLFLAHPRLFAGRQYWCLSPVTPVRDSTTSAVPRGFSDDADYLGPVGRWVERHLQAVPRELRQVHNPESFTHLTLLFLLGERNLRLISVWHPSFLTILMDAIPRHWPAILRELRTGRLDDGWDIPADVRPRLQARLKPDPARAKELASLGLDPHVENLSGVWPRMEVISCWTDGRAEPWLGRIRTLFPGVAIQGKGLLATEGVVTIPTGCGRLRPCAVRSHYLEFRDPATGLVHPLWELATGREYAVVLTTGGGFWRYQLHDRVRVTGSCRATPCLEFLGREGIVSDLVGEKLDERHAACALAAAGARTGWRPGFAMIVPGDSDAQDPESRGASACGYVLVLDGPHDGPSCDPAAFAAVVEEELRGNYHYAHARNMGQLLPLRPMLVPGAAARYCQACRDRGARSGTIKFPALSLETGLEVSRGHGGRGASGGARGRGFGPMETH